MLTCLCSMAFCATCSPIRRHSRRRTPRWRLKSSGSASGCISRPANTCSTRSDRYRTSGCTSPHHHITIHYRVPYTFTPSSSHIYFDSAGSLTKLTALSYCPADQIRSNLLYYYVVARDDERSTRSDSRRRHSLRQKQYPEGAFECPDGALGGRPSVGLHRTQLRTSTSTSVRVEMYYCCTLCVLIAVCRSTCRC